METTHTKFLPSFGEVEQELNNSEVYQQAIAKVASLTGTTVETAKSLLNEIAKETMRVTFHLSFASEAPNPAATD
ncbi:MAG: hypothetical protein SAJ72_23670, partial [Jaaginema sp. PMC 1080.18]|nr:hypothetical protein [Jaaginema sp. PMC 1080.18]